MKSHADEIFDMFKYVPEQSSLATIETLVAYAKGLELSVATITLRDQFAMAAMNGEVMACAGSEQAIDIKAMAIWSYKVADAMLTAREAK